MSKTQTQVMIVWREFLAGVKRRVRLIESIKDAAKEALCPPGALKEMLVELRQLTIKIVEDALEIEYRSQFGDSRPPVKGGASVQLPSIDKFHTLEKKEDILILASMVSDADPLFLLNKVSSLLPVDFPVTRNPLMLGKTIDDLAQLPIPTPEPGNSEQELRALEFMRYKRASKALLKAEAQVLNKMPILLEDVERVWFLKDQNSNVNALLRVAATILNEDNHVGSDREAQLSLLQGSPIEMDPAMFLRGLNKFRSGMQLPADVQAAIRQALHSCDLSHISDPTVEYIGEWVGVVIGTTLVVRRDLLNSSQSQHSKSFSHVAQIGGSRGRSRGPTPELSASTYENIPQQSSIRGTSPDTPMRSRTHHNISRGGTSPPQGDKLSSTIGPGTAPPAPIQKSKHKAKFMAEKADITLASAMGAAKKQDAKRKTEIAKLKANGGLGASEQGELNAIRYELIKMQQELLRRKILDPRHYKAASIDSNEVLEQKKQANPTKATASSSNTSKLKAVRDKKATKQSKMAQNIPLALQKVDWAGHHGTIEIAIEPLTDVIVVKYKEAIQEGVGGGPSEVDGSLAEENILTMKVSKLSLHRLLGKQIDAILEASKDVRKVELLPLFEKFMESLVEYDSTVNKANSTLTSQTQGIVVSPELVLNIERQLVHQQLDTGGVAMEVVVSRDVECSGLLVTCTALPGALRVQQNTKYDTGPVTLFLHDKELQVLLINQRGLFNLAQTKWSCMMMVAQWIISRLHARRIPVFQEQDYIGRVSTASTKNRKSIPEKQSPEKSESVGAEVVSEVAQVANEMIPSDQELILVKEEVSTAVEELVEVDISDGPMLLEVSVDRSVDIAEDVVNLWQARNVPNLMCSSYTVTARQDLEMLIFEVTLKIPDQITGERLFTALSEQQNNVAARAAEAREKARLRKKKGVRIYTMYDEDEEYNSDDDRGKPEAVELLSPEEILANNATYTEVMFSFALMGIELLIFGSTEILEDMHKTSAMTSKKAFQASKFMRNILGRLFLHFKGHKASNIYDHSMNVLDKTQWNMTFDRRLFRDVRTISGGVLIISASVIGAEILFDAQPTEGSIFRQVGSKLFTDEEIRTLVLEEGWPLDCLLPEHRVSLAFRILDIMKVVQSGEFHRLESSSFAESKMITVIRQGTFNKPDAVLGIVEINEHHTLSDLRTIVDYELDKAIIPKKFVFNYKGAACAQRQEQFRKAWDCLPKIFVISLAGAPADEVAELTKKDVVKQEGVLDGKEEVDKKGKMTQSARTAAALVRLNKKLSPVPVPTLCRVYNNQSTVYILHSMVECALAPGDVLRFGSAEGSDFVIPMKRSLKKMFLDNKKFEVDPKITGASKQWLAGNFPKTSERQQKFVKIMPTKEELGYDYLPWTDDTKPVVDNNAVVSAAFSEAMLEATGASPVKAMPTDEIIKQKEENQQQPDSKKKIEGPIFKVGEADLDKRDVENPIEKDAAPYHDVWLWKCIPRGEDKRPLFRRHYDAGLIPYEYKHSKDTTSGLTFFRVFISWKDLELFCTDSRCPSLSSHVQRADERAKLTKDYLLEMAYSRILKWHVPNSIGVDYPKFLKLITETNIFSDIKKAARLYQMEMLFEREVKGPNGVSNKHVNLDGFYNILQDVAIIRFPSTVGDDEDALFDQPSAPPPMPGQAMNRRRGVLQKGNKYMAAHDGLASLVEGDSKTQSSSKERSARNERSHSKDRERSKDRSRSKGGKKENDNDSVDSQNSDDDSEVFYVGSMPPASSVLSVKTGKTGTSTSVYTEEKTKSTDLGNNKSVDFDEESVGSASPTVVSKGSSSPSKDSSRKPRKSVFNNENPSKKAKDEYVPALPRLNRTPQEAEHDDMVMIRLLNDYIMNMEGWQAELWETAKANAMALEALRYGACVRIQASMRKRLNWHRFSSYKQAMIKLQAVLRRRIGIRNYQYLYSLLLEDYIFRARYEGAIRIQSSIRRYNIRCAFLKHMKKIKEQEVILMRARRIRFRKMREKEKKGILFKETRRVAGVPLCLIIKRKDQRNYSNNYGIVLDVYLPDTQTTVKFVIEEPELRKYVQEIINEEAVSIADIMDRRNLQMVVASRLMLRPSEVKAVPHKVSLSRQALGQRGSKKLVRGVRCSGEYFVCTVFSSGASVDVACYHRVTCKVFTCSITQQAIRDWVMSIYGPKKEVEESDVAKTLRKMRQAELQAQREANGEDALVQRTDEPVTVHDVIGSTSGSDKVRPSLLKPENVKQLYRWLVERIAVDKRHGQFRVLFLCQMEKSKKQKGIVKIQALWRRAIVRAWIPYKLDSFWLKVQTSLHEEHAYYVNRMTGDSSWEPSRLLKTWDLPTQPQYRWAELWYSHDSPLFVNPLTGKYTHLSVHHASQIIQATARRWFLRTYRMPAEAFAKCVEFEKTAKQKYNASTTKLSSMINYCLLCFAIRKDDRLARQLLTTAMEMADTNPVVSRLMAVYLLSTCEAPLKSSRDRAAALFRDAKLRDSEARKFEAARDIFKYSCLKKPKDAHIILNLGLLEYFVFDNLQVSEILLRRAVSLLPFDERIVENWKHMRDFFPEKRVLYRPKNQIEKLKQSGVSATGKKKVIHGRDVTEDFAWAGWVYAKSGATTLNVKISKEYWYNPATGEETFNVPNWEEQWAIRLGRSFYQETTDGMEQYYDPLTACYFQRHVLSGTFS